MNNNTLPVAVNEKGFDKFKRMVKEIFGIICRSEVAVSRDKELFRIPAPAFLIIALVTLKLAVIAVIISLFCGVEYSLEGEDFPEPKKLSFRAKN